MLCAMRGPFVANLRRLVLPFLLFALAGCGSRQNGMGSASSCNDKGVVHASGTSWACSDGCNTCSCSQGQIASTELACLPRGADGGADSTVVADAEAGPDGKIDAALDSETDAAPGPHCAGGAGLSNCGATGENCCTSLPVAGGNYYRTYDPLGIDGGVGLAPDGGPTGEADPATVSSFRLDKYLVTVGRFRQFVSAWNAGYVPPVGSGKHTHLNGGNGLNATGGGYEPGWVAADDSNIAPTNANLACDPIFVTWTNATGSQENLPINCVNWYEANAFCIWDGGFLPSEAEWEYAAAGGSEQREYPWGSTAPGTGCPGTGCQHAIYDCDFPDGSGSCMGVANIGPVGYAAQGAGRWGQLDLAGDVFEWNQDSYAPYVDPCTDCADVATPSTRVLRGGAFYYFAPTLLPPNRIDIDPTYRGNYIGFRCSRAP
jgi:formylglycine-generating enzyme required for sulfatase activity